MKNFFCLLLIIYSFGCARIYDNPYDPNTDSEIWMPENLDISIENNNIVRITWHQNEDRIDGFILKNENYPNSLPIVIEKDDTSFIDFSNFINQNCGFQFNYSLKAYAGENYSNEIFYDNCFPSPTSPILTTSQVSNLTTNGAYSGGNITNNGGAAILKRGICYSTSSNPLVYNSSFTNDGTGIGLYLSYLNNLSVNTTYYLKAFALNYSDTAYGNEISFTTLSQSLASITTNPTNSITSNSAISGGNITNNGNSAITSRGICWSTFSSPTTSNDFSNNSGGTGQFTSNLTNLNPNTTYYVRAYATNSIGTAYGNETSFITVTQSVPSLTTNAITSITTSSAQSGGNVTNDGNSTVTSKGICWSTSSGPTTLNNFSNNGGGTGQFTSNLTNLSSNTTYYVRAYASNSTGTAYGNELTFTTSVLTSIPSLTTNSIINITTNSAQSGGNVINDGNSTVTSKGICWSTSANPTNSNVNYMTIDGNGIGSFSSSMTNLSPLTTYYVRAYAANSSGTAYGNEIIFNTIFQNVTCNITSTTNNVNGWYYLLDPTNTVYNSSDTYTIEMSSPSNYHFSPQNSCVLYLNETLIQNIGNQFSSYYDVNGLLIYSQDFIIPSGLTPSNCYNIRVNKSQDTWISNAFTILP